jgi:hypothetical protein
VALVGFAGAPAAGQTLDRVDELARQGQVREARESLNRWWQTESAGASRLDTQRAIWLRALLTSDARQATLDYRRLTVEYPGSQYASDALFRLFQEAISREDRVAAGELVRLLERDYPGSPRGAQARAALTGGGAPAGGSGDPRAAPQAVPSPAPVVTTAAPPPPPPSPATAGDSRPLAIQLGAFGTLAGARALEARARAAGLEVRLVRVPGSDLFRVRFGAFSNLDEVAPHRARAVSLGFEVMLVGDVVVETPVP